jgi:endonuclease/exonuclease/phosphatase (EEP) superfamily protein YafD
VSPESGNGTNGRWRDVAAARGVRVTGLGHRGLARGLMVVVVLAAVAGTFGSLGYLAWWLELFAHFRPQYALCLALAGIGLVLLGRTGVGVAALVLATVNAAPVLHYFRAPPASPVDAGPEIRALLANVYFRNGHHEEVLDYVRSARPDVAVFLEVTPAWSEALQQLAGDLPYQAYAGEIFVASRKPLLGLSAMPLAPVGAMAVSFLFETGVGPVTIIGAHANWPLGPRIAASRNRELSMLAEFAREVSGPVVLLGDLNVTAFSPVFPLLLARAGLADCAAGRGYHPTWPAWFPPLYMQIDHCLAGNGLAVTNFTTGPYIGSDHYPVEVTLRLPAGEATGTALTASRVPPTFRR